jgi:hypothetical protein
MIRALPALLLLSLCACQPKAWDAASKLDTALAYRNFLLSHPTDENAPTAQARLAQLELEAARKVHTVVAYKRWLEEFPEDERVGQARALLEGLRFNAAKEKDTAPAWRLFLRDHPDGAHAAEAEVALSRAELKELDVLDDPKKLEALARRHPEAKGAERALGARDDQVFQEATGARALLDYLREWPAGAHRDEARIKLLTLQLDALLVSGQLDEARAVAKKAPLASKVPGLEARLSKGSKVAELQKSKVEAVQRALPGYYLRSYDELLASLKAPDPIDRWQSAEELGQLVNGRAIDPLLEALRSARSTLVRVRAFDSLAQLLASLPKELAEYEVATRLEGLRELASDERMYLTQAAMVDLLGEPDRAVADYRRAFDDKLPDPVILRRFAQLHRARGRLHSASVAARQLALWAQGVATNEQLSKETAVKGARELCGAFELANFAQEVIAEAKEKGTEFPEDVADFDRLVKGALKAVAARLQDAELMVLEQDGRARRCGDGSVRERLADAENRRIEAVRDADKKAPQLAPLLREVLKQRDPSPKVRAAL